MLPISFQLWHCVKPVVIVPRDGLWLMVNMPGKTKKYKLKLNRSFKLIK